jgi:hypothetical protein
MSPGRWCCARRHRTAKRENKTFGGVIVSTLTKHRTYSGYDLLYVLHTLRYVCPLRTLYWTRLRSINSRARNFTVSYVHSYQVQKTCLRINYFRFSPQPWRGAALAPTMVCGMSTPKPSAYTLGWESCRHVGDMSSRQTKVGTFGRLGQVVPTQIRSRHFFCVGVCRLSPNFL